MSTTEELLTAARDAWTRIGRAESELERLRGYKHMTKPMKDDQRKWHERLRQARVDLAHALEAR